MVYVILTCGISVAVSESVDSEPSSFGGPTKLPFSSNCRIKGSFSGSKSSFCQSYFLFSKGIPLKRNEKRKPIKNPERCPSQEIAGSIGKTYHNNPPYKKTTTKDKAVSWNCLEKIPLKNKKATNI